MNKVIVIQRVCPFYRVPFFRELSRRCDLTLYFGEGQKTGAVKNAQNISGFRFKKLCAWNFGFYWGERNYYLSFFPSLFGNLIHDRPEVIITEGTTNILNNLAVFMFSFFTGTPVIWWDAGRNFEAERNILRKMIEPFLSFFVRRAQACIGYGELARQYLKRLGALPQDVFVAANAVDTESVSAEGEPLLPEMLLKERQRLQLGSRVILFVGALEKRKKLENLFQAYQRLKEQWPDLSLLIIGEGEHGACLRSLAREMRLPDVIFLGEEIKNIALYFKLSDLLVLPGWSSLAVNQAMDYGVPVVTVPYGGPEYELVQDSVTGFLIPKDNIHALTEAIHKILADKALKDRMSRESRRAVGERTIGRMASSFMDAVRYVLAGTGHPVAFVNMITRTPLTRSQVPVISSNREAMIATFVRALRNQGVQADLFVSDAYRPQREEDIGVEAFYLPTRAKWLFWPTRIPFTPQLIRRLKDRYQSVVCSEVFQVSTVLAVIAKMMSRKKMKIIIWQEMAAHQRMCGQLLSKIYHSVLVRFFVDRHVDIYIPRGELARRFLLSQGIAPEKITFVISHGIDPAKFYFNAAVKKERYLFSPSRLVYAKGIDVLLKAFALVSKEDPDITLVIQGNGPGLAEYQQLAGALGVRRNVSFCTERINHEEMREKYQKALMTIIASRSDLVIFSAMESLACGTPVVISDGADSHVDFLDGKGGIVFPQDDSLALSRAILHMLSDHDFRKTMERLALAKAKKYSNDFLGRAFIEAIG